MFSTYCYICCFQYLLGFFFSFRKHSSKGVNIFGTAPLVFVLITLEKYNNVSVKKDLVRRLDHYLNVHPEAWLIS